MSYVQLADSRYGPSSYGHSHHRPAPRPAFFITTTSTTTAQPDLYVYYTDEPVYYTTPASDYYAETIEYSDYYVVETTTPYSYVDPGTYFYVEQPAQEDVQPVVYDNIPADYYTTTSMYPDIPLVR